VFLGFQPLAPIDEAFPISSKDKESTHAQTKADKATQFFEQIKHIRQKNHENLEKYNAKYK